MATSGIDDTMKPFYQRASEAEERLTRLEALVSKRQEEPNTSSKEFSSVVSDLKSKIEAAQNELQHEREKASKEIQKLVADNAKLQYRIIHLVRALKEADSKILAFSNQGT